MESTWPKNNSTSNSVSHAILAPKCATTPVRLDSVHRMTIELRVAQQPQRRRERRGARRSDPSFFRGWTMGIHAHSIHGTGTICLLIYHENQANMGTYIIQGWEGSIVYIPVVNWISTILMVIYQQRGQILHGYVCLRYSIYQTGNWPKFLKQILLVFQFHSEQIEFVKLRDSENLNVLNHWGLVVWALQFTLFISTQNGVTWI